MNEKLLPCPCCGGEAAINTTRTTCRETIKLNKRATGYGVNCVVCGINNRGLVLGYESEELASEAWNRRAAQPAARAEPYGVIVCDKRVQPASGDDARDAARYRFIKIQNATNELRTIAVVMDDEDGGIWVGSDLDLAIDSVMQQERKP